MKLTDIHSNLKRDNDKCVVIIKYGQFYRVFNQDTYIIWYFTLPSSGYNKPPAPAGSS